MEDCKLPLCIRVRAKTIPNPDHEDIKRKILLKLRLDKINKIKNIIYGKTLLL